MSSMAVPTRLSVGPWRRDLKRGGTFRGVRAFRHWFGRCGYAWQTKRQHPGSGSHRDAVTRRHHRRDHKVKTGIHPDYVVTQVTCSCGNTFTTRSTSKSGQLHADVCSDCHPFYTGKQKIMDVGGRVDKFEKRYGKRTRNA
jgi:large subunit ribosomal protein L31